MLKRRGFTLIELLVGIVMLGIVGLVTAQLLMSMMRVTTAQVQIAGAQGTARTGMLVVPQEFREIGYDTIKSPLGSASSDLISIAANRITFRAMRGVGMTCAVTASFGPPGSIDAIWIRLPVFGMRPDGPAATDSVLMFVENERNRGDDDQWVFVDVSSVDPSATCGADKAIKLTFATPPKHYLPSFDNILPNEWQLGGPVRWYERMEYGPVIDATTGRTYVGARSENVGGPLQPMIGPIPDSSGFALTYYDANGTVLDPATAQKIDVRSIGISLTGTTTAPLSLAGSSSRARSNVPVFTRVALRNILRP